MIRSPDALSNGGKRNQPSESELEGESSLFTQAGHATKFLQDAVQSEHAMHAASPEALQALDTLREASETRGMVVPGDSVGNMYPHATPSLRGSGVGDNGPRPMPPIEMAVACLRKLKTNPRVKFFWALEFQSTGEFIEHLLTVYSTDQATVADHIIVNAGLYWLLVECSNIVDSQALTTEYTRQSKVCQSNLETTLSSLPFDIPSTLDMVLALSMAASYMLERCKPSVAWGFIVAASHKSQLLGFHRLATPGRARAAPKKRSTRIFWVIYITEKMLSLRLGRPSTIRDIDISVQLTADVLDSDGAVLPIPARWVHIAQLHGKVYEEIYSLSALGQAEGVRIIRAKSLADELFRVYHAPSPSETCLEVARRQALGESLHELFTRAFHVSYLSLLTLIYRGIPTDGAAGNVAFCDECIVTARQAMEEHGRCIRLLREQTDNVHAFYISWILLMSPFVPFTVLFCHVIQTSDPTDLEHLKSVVEVLQSMPASYVETYSKQHRLFKHFYDVACRYVEVKASARETHPDGSFERLVRESDLKLPIQPSGIDAAETGGTGVEDIYPQPNEVADDGLSQEECMEEEITQLARRFTSHSQHQPSLFPLPTNGPLNPESPDFNPRKWAKAFFALRRGCGDGVPPRTTGIAFRDLSVYGFGTATDYQKTVGNLALEGVTVFKKLLLQQKQQRIDILHNLEGVVHNGEMLAVLGPPGSGCSTLLRTIAGDTHGFHVSDDTTINYQGIRAEQMKTAFRGEAIYTAEVDAHFPHMTVGDTLYFAALARCPKTIPDGVSRSEYAEHLREVTMAMFGISHTKNTRVGDDFIRGVSGGERKRVTISEAALSHSPLQCWDNSTRGLDSANALEFCKTLRTQADILGSTACVAIYQASQDAYEVFDKVIVLYEGRQIFFGRTEEAKAYFEGLGFICPERQTTADFLTSMTSHQERVLRPGCNTPRSPDEFADAWRQSEHRLRLVNEIDNYLDQHPFNGKHYNSFLASRRSDQATSQRESSPFTLSYWQQVKLTLWRSWVLLKSDPSMTLTMLVTNIFMALVMSSIFYNMPNDSSSISRRGTLMFFIVLTNAFGGMLEIMTLYAKRPIVEKHNRYALYHPSAEALAAMIVDLPYKTVNSILTNLAIYFMCNLRREVGPFFFFFLVIYIVTLTMSMMFRLMGSLTKTIAQALAPASVILLVICLYTGFAIRIQYMQVWLGWLRWINPVQYGFESLLVNEFVGRAFRCVAFVPAGPDYGSVEPSQRVCTVAGSTPGSDSIEGAAYINASYGYQSANRWRNVGIMIVFGIAFMVGHLVAAEYVASERSKGEVLVFRRKAISSRGRKAQDVESGSSNRPSDKNPNAGYSSGDAANMERATSIFHWKDICYDIKIKDEPRRILDNVDGWVKPGTLTALMGVSGAGKTTLLDVLASRVTMGVISGSMLVDGNPRDASFQRQTGYVQQQDLHLHTSTVREALSFSAMLRQSSKYSRQEKLDYVDTVIGLLDMQQYADAVIGVPGEGLNVEQRKRLTIGVELAARPQLLLFLDEPTSGLDSQTSWSVCNLMEKLTNSGQAILCTIHQPSAILFQRFDRLLLLARGGRTVYFGPIGKNSQTLNDYFVRNGGPACTPEANPAEHMLHVIGAAPGTHSEIDWPDVWRRSPEYRGVQDELERLEAGRRPIEENQDLSKFSEFAVPLSLQYREVCWRVFQQYWRSPSYLMSKAFLSCGAALFIGLSFLNIKNTQDGLQNQIFGVFIFLTVFSQLVDQILPIFVSQRTMYEARERPSKTYSWVAFLGANMLVEAFWNSLLSVLSYILWYFPMGLYQNARQTGAEHSRGVTVFLFVWVFFLFSSTFAHLIIAGLDSFEVAGGVVGLITVLMFSFCGILAGPKVLPGFWIFMYRVNPFTYFVEGFLGTALANAAAICSDNEYVSFNVPKGSTCGEYMQSYLEIAGGFVEDPDSTGRCRFCAIADTNTFLSGINVDFANRWRNFGFMWVFIVFNVVVATALYWLARVPKKSKVKSE
ncbi:hypothetical protein ACHAP6_007004 [Verticillium nonalfalfae]